MTEEALKIAKEELSDCIALASKLANRLEALEALAAEQRARIALLESSATGTYDPEAMTRVSRAWAANTAQALEHFAVDCERHDPIVRVRSGTDPSQASYDAPLSRHLRFVAEDLRRLAETR